MRILALGVLAGALVLLCRFCLEKTDGFTIHSISSDRPYNALWETRPLTALEERGVEDALEQRFTYFGCGGQAYIFFSEDGQVVLKLLKQHPFDIPWWFSLPLPSFIERYKEKKRWQRHDKLLRDFTSYKSAFVELQELTGVLFVHLNPTNHLHRQICITDKLGIVHHLEADRFNFILQRRARLIYEVLDELMAEGRQAEAAEKIAQVLLFFVHRCEIGIHDRDPNIRTNCGFLDDRVIKIDIGRLSKNEEERQPAIYTKELLRVALPFKEWLHEKHPSLLPAFTEELHKCNVSLP